MKKLNLVFWVMGLSILAFMCSSPNPDIIKYKNIQMRIDSVEWWEGNLVLKINIYTKGQELKFKSTDFIIIDRNGQEYQCTGFNSTYPSNGIVFTEMSYSSLSWAITPNSFLFEDVPYIRNPFSLRYKNSNSIEVKPWNNTHQN